jgi:hypothetical protein
MARILKVQRLGRPDCMTHREWTNIGNAKKLRCRICLCLGAWLLTVWFRCATDGVTCVDPGHQELGTLDMRRWAILHSGPHIRKGLRFKSTHASLQLRMPGTNKGCVMVYVTISRYVIGSIVNLHSRITEYTLPPPIFWRLEPRFVSGHLQTKLLSFPPP